MNFGRSGNSSASERRRGLVPLAVAHQALRFKPGRSCSRRSVRSVRGNQWMFRMVRSG